MDSLSSRHLIHSSCGNGGGYAHSVVRRRRPSPACGHGEGGRPRRLFGAVRGARHGRRGAGGRRQRVELPVQRRRAPLRRARPCAGGRGGAAARVALLRELRFDAPARALAAEEALQPGWLYFALPMSMLRRPLSGQEMAALAVKASSALAVASGLLLKQRNRPDPDWSSLL
ncbi:uncharacterized protein LOC119344304 [Triticum dicoccoides]|uniref:uncharacterized protein LOC119344304 n=1 Tax=Triticum dicoccoides TaxID=85692 RepID=UPI0018907206|nr:uncharacterized protein LOC119344304 [Triticum dicoccoides]